MAFQSIETQILNRLVKDILKAGYLVHVMDGEEFVLRDSNSFVKIRKAMESTDEDYLFLKRDGQNIGWVRLIYGNDNDVISDYTSVDEIEAIIDPIYKDIDTFENK